MCEETIPVCEETFPVCEETMPVCEDLEVTPIVIGGELPVPATSQGDVSIVLDGESSTVSQGDPVIGIKRETGDKTKDKSEIVIGEVLPIDNKNDCSIPIKKESPVAVKNKTPIIGTEQKPILIGDKFCNREEKPIVISDSDSDSCEEWHSSNEKSASHTSVVSVKLSPVTKHNSTSIKSEKTLKSMTL